ncbi:MAG TPA: Holliday junction branch migration protein RuvA [Spirochaetia bacterium]|nr:Holliday junction branch migration protein RuvA [Spirochaetia bacterium]
MFNSLSGTVTFKSAGVVHLMTGGIEWDITMPEASLDRLPAVNETAQIFIYLYHRDDQMRLFGFADPNERKIFLELQKVDGVGPRQALRILSGTPPEMLLPILDAGDIDALARTPGVGKKTAQKIVLALRGKLTFEGDAAAGPADDMVAALGEMGFDKKLAQEAVAAVTKELAEAGESGADHEEEIMRRAIVRLSNRS